MAINATIQVRRGLLKDFDPTKMLPGEWAVSIDSSTSNQIVWMCFAPGVCKRMGTYEDFQNMIYNATGEIIERYEDAFGSILEEVNTNAEAVSANTDIVLVAKSDIINTYLPQIKSYVSNASASASEAKTYSENAKASASEADKSAEDAKKYSQNAFSTTPEGYEALVGDVDVLKNSIIQTTGRTLYGSKEGGIKLIGIGGASEQGENPSPDYPQEIESVGDSGSLMIKAEGKNLITTRGKSGAVNGVTVTVNEDGSIVLNGTAGSGDSTVTGYNFVANFTGMVKLTGGYSYECHLYPWCSTTRTRPYADESKTTLATGEQYDSKGEMLFYVEKGLSYGVRPRVFGGNTVTNAVVYPMIRKADIADDIYEPYRSKSITIPLNEPLYAVDEDCKDGIVFKDGRFKIERNCYALWLNGSEFWGALNLENCFYTNTVKGISKLSNENMLSTHYIRSASSINEMPDKTIGQAYTTTTNASILRIKDSSYTTVDELKAGLAENPIFCVVKRAEPIYEDIEDQTPFYGLESFDTVTYISTDSEVEPSIELKFAKTEGDAVTLLNYNGWNLARLENEALKNVILSLGGNV